MPKPSRVLLLAAAVALTSTSLSAHVIRGILYPTQATALISSPSAADDAVIPIVWAGVDTGQRVACFNVANTSPAQSGGYPRITAVGFELPGARAGFTVMTPGEGEWRVVSNVPASLLGRGNVTLDFALLSSGPGLPAGQAATRGSGTRFCVSGPFPDGANIETLINGVVVGYQAQPNGPIVEVGLWENAQRVVPLFP